MEESLKALASTPSLLVATDFDGTLAPIVDEPGRARALPAALRALRGLAALPQTHVAVISGRPLAQLEKFFDFSSPIHLIGSHGAEFDADVLDSIPTSVRDLKPQIELEIEALIKKEKGFSLEKKPLGFTIHYRKRPENLDPLPVLDRVVELMRAYPQVKFREGKKVFEYHFDGSDKGEALEKLRHLKGATQVIFLGDDRTDEDAFRKLGQRDLGVKVGEGESVASARLSDPKAVASALAQLYEYRKDWLRGSEATLIQNLSLLSDHRTFALVDPAARINWLCAPRGDSPSIFGELIGGESAGFFSVAPMESKFRKPTQAYLNHSLLLKTNFGSWSVLDYLDVSEGLYRRRAGRLHLVRALEGSGKVKVQFAPRPDYGRMITQIRKVPEGLEVVGTAEPAYLLSSEIDWKIEKAGDREMATAIVDLDLHKNKSVVLELMIGARPRGPRQPENRRRAETLEYWKSWVKTLEFPEGLSVHHRWLSIRSALTLKALAYHPTGAFYAAATTSLPEQIGGSRNWDYRFCWLRDAAVALRALVRLGSVEEALSYLDWLFKLLESLESPERFRPLYDVHGHNVISDATIAELSGYAGSRPVRIGNSAAQQLQLDVFGPICDLIFELAGKGAPLSIEHWKLTAAMAEAVCNRWHEPDHGIWEIRDERKHYTYSKVMCWFALDRCIGLGDHFSARDLKRWQEVADQIKAEVLEKAWSEKRQSYTAAYGFLELDAAVMWMGLSGMIDLTDPRWRLTLQAIEKELVCEDGVYRYRFNDMLNGEEGVFQLCTSWWIRVLLAEGRQEEADAMAKRWEDAAGKTGLFSEESEPKTLRGLGNHPQAYSHAGYLEWTLDRIEWLAHEHARKQA